MRRISASGESHSGRYLCTPHYASSMPKLGPTGTKTDQLEFVNFQTFRGFYRKRLVGVTAGIALITRPSARAERGKTSPSKKFGTKPYHCVAGHPNRCW